MTATRPASGHPWRSSMALIICHWPSANISLPREVWLFWLVEVAATEANRCEV